ncbi:ABC transporter substrate-binding protein [Dermabacter hominis]|uniref:Substrate-binding domain-containing protein n=1 Tax=Dermabacter vaginalis TaxID=1630135 RepID=A0ABX6A3W9_9MICO|nr:ABC transporter substrate-binding protein [Dermabacter vaginalis]MDK8803548.1 ABC transporter substrate-binding protein [Dermabacter hominis]QEU11041.1 substrate-binding domain-containing protein [Dermabacter vaginalis]
MKISRRAVLGTAFTATAFGLSACTTGDETVKPRTTKIESIGLMVQDMSNPFFAAMEKGAKTAAHTLGADLNVQDAQLDLAEQYNQIDNFILQGVDLIVVSAIDSEGIVPAIKRAQNNGAIVIAVDTAADGASATVMTNAVEAGEISARYLFEQMGGAGRLLIVDGTPLQTIRDRVAGCMNVLEEFPDIKIAGHQSSNNDRASSLTVTTDMLTSAPDVSGIWAMNDPSALGAVLAVEQAGLTDQVIVTGIDGSPEGVEELKRPGSPFIGFATQNPAEMVRQGVLAAQDIIAGKPPADPTILIPSELYTRDDIDTYEGW